MKLDGNYCGRLQPIALSRWFPGKLCSWLAVVMAFLASDRIESAAIGVQPASAAAKPGNYADRIRVKFRDDLPIRLRDGQLTDAGSGTLNALAPFLDRLITAGATWRRQHSLPEATLAQLRQTAQTNLNRAVADLNTGFILRLPPGLDAGAVIEQFNTWPQVELARPMRRPVPLPTSSMIGISITPTSRSVSSDPARCRLLPTAPITAPRSWASWPPVGMAGE
jgi:hypothetical protein